MDVRLLIKLYDDFVRRDGSHFDFPIKLEQLRRSAIFVALIRNCFFVVLKLFK